jgi:hypothetical protein
LSQRALRAVKGVSMVVSEPVEPRAALRECRNPRLSIRMAYHFPHLNINKCVNRFWINSGPPTITDFEYGRDDWSAQI